MRRLVKIQGTHEDLHLLDPDQDPDHLEEGQGHQLVKDGAETFRRHLHHHLVEVDMIDFSIWTTFYKIELDFYKV